MVKNIPDIIRCIWLYGLTIALIILCYTLFLNRVVGQDIVLQTGEPEYFSGPFFYSIIVSGILIAIIWYSGRIVAYEKTKEGTISEPVLRHAPRLLAYNALLIIPVSILHLQTILNLSGWWLFAFWLCMNIYYFLFMELVEKAMTSRSTSARSDNRFLFLTLFILVTCLVYISCIIWLIHQYYTDWDQMNQHQFWLPVNLLIYFLLQNFLIAFFILRRNKMIVATKEEVRILWFNVPKEEKSTFSCLFIFIILLLIIYFFATFSIYLSRTIGPLAIAFGGIGFLIGFSNLITYFSIKKKINFHFLFILLVIITSGMKNPYAVNLKPSHQPKIFERRPNLRQYITRWVSSHPELKDSTVTEYPVYIVLSDGGASRSGYWVASILSMMEDMTQKKDSTDLFSRHLLCLAGASGGSVGNAVFFSLLKQRPFENSKTQKHPYYLSATNFLGSDFLSFLLGRLFGSDLLHHIFPFLKLPDRAAALESSFENDERHDTLINRVFKTTVDQVFDDPSGKLPLLIINTTCMRDGSPAIISNVKMGDTASRRDVLSLIDCNGTLHQKGNLNFSTSVILGARFPYVSPAGEIGNYYFVDGGYYDNSGSGSALEMYQNLQKILNDTITNKKGGIITKAIVEKLRFKLIHISNQPVVLKQVDEIHPLVNDLASPLITVLGLTSSITNGNDQLLINEIKKQNGGISNIFKAELYTDKDSITYPMNWVISEYNLNRMRKRMIPVTTDLYRWMFMPKILSN